MILVKLATLLTAEMFDSSFFKYPVGYTWRVWIHKSTGRRGRKGGLVNYIGISFGSII